jgi:hypothetical protein
MISSGNGFGYSLQVNQMFNAKVMGWVLFEWIVARVAINF